MTVAVPQLLVERLEVLAGTRGKASLRKAAVRIEDLAVLLEIDARLKSARAAGSTPTQAEFDALVDDVAMLHRYLVALATALQGRLL